METVSFKPDGGPLVAEVRTGQAAVGSYSLRLWEADANLVVMKRKGNFVNPDDDAYELPLPNEHNHRRIVECIATVVITPPISNYEVELVISQDGARLGGQPASGANASGAVTVDLFVMLVAEGAA
jgi:hypothetical protein